MSVKKTVIAFFALLMLVCSVAFAESNGASMTPPSDYDAWSDSQFGLRDTIGYGNLETDPDAHGLTVYSTQTTTPELGDSSMATAVIAGMCAVAFVGVIAADKKRRSLNY